MSSKSIYFWFEICGVSADSAGWGLKTVLNSAASREVLSFSCLWSNGENWDVHDPTFKINSSIESVAELRKNTCLHFPDNYTKCNSRQQKGRDVYAKGEGAVPSLCALVSIAPSHQLPVFKNTQAFWAQFLCISSKGSLNKYIGWIISHWWLISFSGPSTLHRGSGMRYGEAWNHEMDVWSFLDTSLILKVS